MSLSKDNRIDEAVLEGVNGGLFGFGEDTKTVYCTNCKQPFKIPASKKSGKCPDCGKEAFADRAGSWSDSFGKA